MAWLLLQDFYLFDLSTDEEVRVEGAAWNVLRNVSEPDFSDSDILALKLLSLHDEGYVRDRFF